MSLPYLLQVAAVSQSQPSATQEAVDLPHKIYILPQSIPMWPPVWWTWLILATVVLLIVGILLYVFLRYRKNAYRREAIKLIKESHSLADAEFLKNCHQIVRRCLITKQRHDLASLSNTELFARLDKEMKGKKSFSQLGDVFIKGAYQPQLSLSEEQKTEIFQITKHWCRRHNA